MREWERVEVTSRAQWRAWLAAHHDQIESIWLVTHKKVAGDTHLPYDAVVEEALAFGWVDSQPRRLDARRSMRLLSPRKPGSAWSKANKTRIDALIDSGRMHAAGLAKVAAAKADGSWTSIDHAETLALPADLARALRGNADAATHFAAFPPSTRRAILEWIGNAKITETRGKRIAETVRKAAENIRANQYRQPKHP